LVAVQTNWRLVSASTARPSPTEDSRMSRRSRTSCRGWPSCGPRP